MSKRCCFAPSTCQVDLLRLVVLALVVFAVVATWALTGNSAWFDLGGVRFLQSFGTPSLDRAVAYFTLFGSTPGVIIAVSITAGWAALRHERRLALGMLAVGVLDEISYPILKLIFQRDRPQDLATAFLPTTFSFPSGHATASVAVYGMIAYVFARLYPRLRMTMAIGAPIFALALGLSRPYLGVHWPTDILAGFALGTLILVGGIRLVHSRPDVRDAGARTHP